MKSIFQKTLNLFIISTVLLLTNCQSDENSLNSSDNTEIKASKTFLFKSKLETRLNEFAKEHVSIGNDLLLTLDKDDELNFDSFPYTQLELSQDEEAFKLAFSRAGISNNEKAYDLLLKLNKNAKKFTTNNEEFTSLKMEERESLITSAVKEVIIGQPLFFIPPDGFVNTTLGLSCFQKYAQDRDDCAQDSLINLAIVAGGCWFGTPVACAVGGVGVLAIAAVCSNRAKRDYKQCLSK